MHMYILVAQYLILLSRITSEDSIQMMTALVLQLVHSVINCKPKEDKKHSPDTTPNSADSMKETPVNEVCYSQ